ncbi:MAG: hypothetical protein AAB403_19965 [Planctomycetota bacterium]
MRDAELQDLIGRQKKAENLPRELDRLQAIQSRVHSRTLDEVIQLKSRGMNPVVFPDAPFRVPDLDRFTDNEVPLGMVEVSRPGAPQSQCLKLLLTDTREHLSHHLGCVGGTGSGKSALAQGLFAALVDLPDTSATYFAPEGNELRMLALLSEPNTLILQCDDLHSFNVLAGLPDVSPELNADDFLRAFFSRWTNERTYGLLKPFLVQFDQDLKRGFPRGLPDLIDAVAHHIHNREVRDFLLGRLGSIDVPFFRGRQPFPVQLLAEANAIRLTKTLPRRVESMLIQIMQARALRYRIWKNDSHMHVVFIDEAQSSLNVSGMEPQTIQELPTADAINRGRKHGLVTCWISTSIADIDPTFVRLSGTLLIGGLDHPIDKSLIQRAVMMDPRQSTWYSEIKPQQFLLKSTGTAVFPIMASQLKLGPSDLSQKEIDAWNKRVLKSHPDWAPLLKAGLPAVQQTRVAPGSRTVAVGGQLGAIDPQPPTSIGDSDERLFLAAVNENPYRQVTDYYDILDEQGHMGQAKAADLRQKLEGAGMLKVHSIRTGARGGQKGLEITDAACQKYGLKKKLVLGKGADYEHSYLVANLERHFSDQHKTVEHEALFGSHRVDFLVDKILPVEVAIGNKCADEARGILKDLERADTVLVVGNDKVHLEGVRKALPANVLSRAQIKLFCEVMDG